MKLKTFLKVCLVLAMIAGAGFLSYKMGFLAGQEDVLRTAPAYIMNLNGNGTTTQNVDFNVFWETWRKLENNFLEKETLNPQTMLYGAIEGMVRSVGDPYTVFFTPRATSDFKEELSGKYEGVGMYVGIKDNQLTVISPIKGTPAFNVGLLAGDKILKIDDSETTGLSIDEAVSKIKGPSGTTVKLTIRRGEEATSREFVVKRANIKIPTVDFEIVGGNKDIALVKVYQFNEILISEFAKIANQILSAEVDKIIIDLRNNPGGYLEVAQQIAGWFLEKGDIVVWQENKIKGERIKTNLKAQGPAIFSTYPVVVLINHGSASASEILAGALRDNRGSALVGETSFGKGSVQEQLTLSDGSSLKVTTLQWLTPNGDLINGVGLTPDFIVEITEDDNEEIDRQLLKAIELLE